PSRELERQHEELLTTLGALQRAERLAQQATREQAELLELVPAIVWMAKPDGSWTFVSQRWTERIGELPPSSRDRWTDAAAEPTADEVLRLWGDGIASRVAFTFELALKTADGPARWHRLRAVPILSGGSVEKWLGVLVDIDDSRQREAQASRVATFMKQMIGVVGHDLRAPLNVATAAAGALRVRTPNVDEAMVERIESSMLRASRMISSLLDYTRAELGEGIPIRPERCDVEAALRELAEATQTAHPQARIELSVRGETRWRVDIDRVIQAVGNLLENAVAHADLSRPITVDVVGDADRLEVVVSNHGPPIDDDVLQTLFEPFRRGDSGKRRGLGLGLFIVAEIARGHGGTAEMESDERGTRARIVIPRPGGLPAARG
ncbi:MAG: HAMP domain-containing sensor histidine kinase, partial [Polyangiaceae bacterium]